MTTAQHEKLRSFLLWAIAELELPYVVENEIYRVEVPEGRAAQFGGQSRLSLVLDGAAMEGQRDEPLQQVTADSPLIDMLCTALTTSEPFVHARPATQPERVHRITERLFPAYTIDDGSIGLAGCTLEDRPFLRLTYRCTQSSPERVQTDAWLQHIFVDASGELVSSEMVASLHLEDLVSCPEEAPAPASIDLEQLAAAGERAAQAQIATEDASTNRKLLLRTVVWCKYAEGKLRFTVGDLTEELSFADWAQTLEPPPFVCPYTGSKTYHLAATDDGRITSADQIEACAETGRRVLAGELVHCEATGKHVLPEFAQTCPVTGKPVLREAMVVCPVCQQHVSPKAMARGSCRACRSLSPVSKTEARLARLLGEYPALDHWRGWKLAETQTVYIAIAGNIFHQLLLVVDKHDLRPRHLATRGLFPRRWTPVEAAHYDEMLR